MFIFLAMLTAYLITSTIATRKIYARTLYTVSQSGRMKNHKRGCRAVEFSITSNQRRFCRCGYFDINDAIPHPAILFALWPFFLFTEFLTSGTYNPKGVDYQRIKELENELDMMRGA